MALEEGFPPGAGVVSLPLVPHAAVVGERPAGVEEVSACPSRLVVDADPAVNVGEGSVPEPVLDPGVWLPASALSALPVCPTSFRLPSPLGAVSVSILEQG